MTSRAGTIRSISFLVFALVVASCSGGEFASETSTGSESTEISNDTAEVSQDVAVGEDPDETAEAETNEQDLQSVTAITVHEASSDEFPDIVAAQATPSSDGTWRFDVTVSSTYDSPERYADAWRVVGPEGIEYGIRVLTHDHAGEQPFTRSQSGIAIPADITTVTIEGRDLDNGWGGGTLEIILG